MKSGNFLVTNNLKAKSYSLSLTHFTLVTRLPKKT